MIADEMLKAVTNDKYYLFIKQLFMSLSKQQ